MLESSGKSHGAKTLSGKQEIDEIDILFVPKSYFMTWLCNGVALDHVDKCGQKSEEGNTGKGPWSSESNPHKIQPFGGGPIASASVNPGTLAPPTQQWPRKSHLKLQRSMLYDAAWCCMMLYDAVCHGMLQLHSMVCQLPHAPSLKLCTSWNGGRSLPPIRQNKWPSCFSRSGLGLQRRG